jgi:hypothetical protein
VYWNFRKNWPLFAVMVGDDNDINNNDYHFFFLFKYY